MAANQGSCGAVSQRSVLADWFPGFVTSTSAHGVRLAHALCADSAQAEEVVQDAYADLYRRLLGGATIASPEAWLKSAIVNRSRSLLRRRYVALRAFPRAVFVSIECPQQDRDVWAAVRRLPRRQAQVIALYTIADFDISQIAQELRCAEATVRVHLHRARKALASDPTVVAAQREQGHGN
jgi:RNA polymerase sigma factor (sigma-70 family)